MKWIPFPDARLEVRGLPWFKEIAPRLWRFPPQALAGMPKAVQALGRMSCGGRIRFASSTSQLRIRFEEPYARAWRNMSFFGSGGLDAYVNGIYWGSVCAEEKGEREATFFAGAKPTAKDITIYLPAFQAIRVMAIGVDSDAELKPAAPFALDLPIVFYGSSVAQGGCACRPGMSYEAILARRMNVDFVNLGFSGSGKAEPEVVEWISKIDACCYVFDLGKSYRMQPPEVYGKMLDMIRAAHPNVPLVCLTPIFSTREFYDPNYTELSRHVRDAMRFAATQRIQAGDANVHLVDGLKLLGPDDADTFHEGVHPTDLGFMRVADRLQPVLEGILFLKGN